MRPTTAQPAIGFVSAHQQGTIRLALLPDDGPTGGFFNASRRQPW